MDVEGIFNSSFFVPSWDYLSVTCPGFSCVSSGRLLSGNYGEYAVILKGIGQTRKGINRRKRTLPFVTEKGEIK